ncbi:hypothetical protein [Polynucleobacter nymphae]|uniref:hypothetical protein n=1 Tax=Polynucleobacter nymphae TaxID=2081043 RepID=UPI001C0C09AD|nr:hypothetical protein [Polynucleobacter nymphae]MBU3606863.1 hypothetical protein [Polynucleobacter nymphae]
MTNTCFAHFDWPSLSQSTRGNEYCQQSQYLHNFHKYQTIIEKYKWGYCAMGSILLWIFLISGGFILWKKLTTKNFFIARESDEFGYLRMFLYMVFYPLVMFLTIWIGFQIFPELKGDKVLSFLVLIIEGIAWFYLVGKIEGWVVKK